MGKDNMMRFTMTIKACALLLLTISMASAMNGRGMNRRCNQCHIRHDIVCYPQALNHANPNARTWICRVCIARGLAKSQAIAKSKATKTISTRSSSVDDGDFETFHAFATGGAP